MITNTQQKKRNALAESLFEAVQHDIIDGQNYTGTQQKLGELAEAIRTGHSFLTVKTYQTDTETGVTLCLSGHSFIIFSLMTTNGKDCFFSITPPIHDIDILTQITLLTDLIETVRTLFKAKSSHGP